MVYGIMGSYEETVRHEFSTWKKRMQEPPSLASQVAKKLQTKINQAIPEKIHVAFTAAIKQMTRGVIAGAEFTTAVPLRDADLASREVNVRDRIKFYSNTAAAEGALTGAGGILLGLADFPIWLTLKMKMLFEIAALYGRDVSDYRERLYILHVFQLTFSSHQHRRKVFDLLANWTEYHHKLPPSIQEFDWRSFQQEYRDYIDLAKLLQLVPGIGAVVGAMVNHRLTNKLGDMAMNAYRLRMPELA